MLNKVQKDIKEKESIKVVFTKQKRIDKSPIVPVNEPVVDIELIMSQKAIQVDQIVPINQPIVKMKNETVVKTGVKIELK